MLNDAPLRWALYARAELAQLRAYVEGESGGVLHVECFDVGQPGTGRQALLRCARTEWLATFGRGLPA
ncbi:hypothetical protein AB0F88_17005 [Streptosporangium sp. NPDC023963]|uniref:hypothetical protein n=1 Tax=Streptosporangium sp. NPDC023963 TaxID=3155608 RepID=UPI00343B164D